MRPLTGGMGGVVATSEPAVDGLDDVWMLGDKEQERKGRGCDAFRAALFMHR